MGEGSLGLAFILVAKAELPSAGALIEAAKRYGHALQADVSQDAHSASFERSGGGSLLVALMPAPHPDVPHMTTGPTSPSREELSTHRAHLIVTALGLEGDVRARDAALAGLASAVATACPSAVGMMLGHGVIFHKVPLYCELAALALEEGELPAEIAVDLTTGPEPGERMSFLTHGMARYGREELYVTCPIRGKGALGFVFDMVRWLLTDRAKELPTGDTLGRTKDEKILVQRVESPTGQGPPVIRLDLPA